MARFRTCYGAGSYSRALPNPCTPACSARLRNVELDKLNALQIRALHLKIDEGLSDGTVRNLHVILLASLKQSVKWKLARSNVCASVAPPRRTQHQIKPLSTNQVKVLLDATMDDSLYSLYVLAATTGMRQTEP